MPSTLEFWLAWSCVDLMQATIAAASLWVDQPYHVKKTPFYHSLPQPMALKTFLLPFLWCFPSFQREGVWYHHHFSPVLWWVVNLYINYMIFFAHILSEDDVITFFLSHTWIIRCSFSPSNLVMLTWACSKSQRIFCKTLSCFLLLLLNSTQKRYSHITPRWKSMRWASLKIVTDYRLIIENEKIVLMSTSSSLTQHTSVQLGVLFGRWLPSIGVVESLQSRCSI